MPGLVASYDLWPGNGRGLFVRNYICQEVNKELSKQVNNLYSIEIKK